MSDSPDQDGDGWLTPWEKKCLDEWEKEAVLEERAQSETDRCEQKIWQSFQNSASAISHLYKEGSQQSIHLWVPFQSAAGAATVLFKDSQDMIRRSFELGTAVGGHRKSREMLAWIRKQRRRQLAREDIVAFVCGRSAPNRPHRTSSTSYVRSVGGVRLTGGGGVDPGVTSPRFMPGGGVVARGGYFSTEPDLTTFKDALAIQGLNGAMSNVSVGRRSSQTSFGPGGAASHHSPLRSSSSTSVLGGSTGGSHDDLHGFLVEQFVRHSSGELASRKRTASTDGRGSGSDSPGGCKRNRMETDD